MATQDAPGRGSHVALRTFSRKCNPGPRIAIKVCIRATTLGRRCDVYILLELSQS